MALYDRAYEPKYKVLQDRDVTRMLPSFHQADCLLVRQASDSSVKESSRSQPQLACEYDTGKVS